MANCVRFGSFAGKMRCIVTSQVQYGAYRTSFWFLNIGHWPAWFFPFFFPSFPYHFPSFSHHFPITSPSFPHHFPSFFIIFPSFSHHFPIISPSFSIIFHQFSMGRSCGNNNNREDFRSRVALQRYHPVFITTQERAMTCFDERW